MDTERLERIAYGGCRTRAIFCEVFGVGLMWAHICGYLLGWIMSDTASIVSAAAASAAAVLAMANLYFSGRWERNRWARDSLVDAFHIVLDASFTSGRAARHIAMGDGRQNEELLGEIERAHSDQINTITRLRLLTKPRVVETAMALHLADHAASDLVKPREDSWPTVDADVLAQRSQDVWKARQAFLYAAKAEIGLPSRVAGYMSSHSSREHKHL